MKLIDSHCHLEFDNFDHDREQMLARLQEKLELAIQVASDISSNQKVIDYILRYPFIYGALGLHPHDSKDFTPQFETWLSQNISHPKILAVGEIGLDYFKIHSPVETQKHVFRQLLRFAKLVQKPVIIHSREAFEDIFKILNEEKMEQVLFHCFSENWDNARRILDQGFMISLSATITYPKNQTGQEVAAKIPLDRLLLETDAPFLSPQAFRGKRNEPAYVEYTAKKVAELKAIPLELVINKTTENAKRFFNL